MLHNHFSFSLGADPELFLAKDGRIVGSERLIPPAGLSKGGAGKIIRDGVQVELNPSSNYCRQVVGGRIKSLLSELEAIAKNGGYSLCFDGVVKVDKQELELLSPKSQQFGCKPSFNYYDNTPNRPPDGFKYRYRAAGGHIHLGLPSVFGPSNLKLDNYSWAKTPKVDHRPRLIPVLDLLVGNTAVLLDRDPLQVERRRYYGKAGEYRLPPYGLEYRTPSNFWLRSYPMMSLMFGLARLSANIMANTLAEPSSNFAWVPPSFTKFDYEEDLLKDVDFTKVRQAINTNNFDLAMENFEHVERFFMKHKIDGPFWSRPSINKFKKIVRGIQAGQDFPIVDKADVWEHWKNVYTMSNNTGWEGYLSGYRVRK
jgi:hypothetical protein